MRLYGRITVPDRAETCCCEGLLYFLDGESRARCCHCERLLCRDDELSALADEIEGRAGYG